MKPDKTAEDGRPLLSIGIIFRDEIRCLERCMRSLVPLRQALPCQLVMGDTGSKDGSRRIAEEFADVLFDFPWIDDFSAAKNALLDHCAGTWVLMVDSDEWLDPDFSQLTDFLQGEEGRSMSCGMVIQRNYNTEALDRYTDVPVPRLLRMSREPRFQGIIHESPVFLCPERISLPLNGVILHHDGYVGLYITEAGRQRRARNIRLLRRKVEENPQNLNARLQFLDSGQEEPDFLDQLCETVSMVERGVEDWEYWGQVVMRDAVVYAYNHQLPTLEAWIETADRLFPRSYFNRIDLSYVRFAMAHNSGDYEGAVAFAEQYLAARRDLLTDPVGQLERGLGILQWDNAWSEETVRGALEKDRERVREEREEASRAAGAELLALAERVRAILASFPPDDPAVVELKKSPVYQRVRSLLE